jgi:hypothetical protein
VEQTVLAGVGFLQLAPIFDELYEAVVVCVPNGDHGRCFFEFILGSIGEDFFLEDEVHDISVACACKEMEEVASVFSQGPQIDVGIVHEKFYALDVVLENGVVESSVTLLAFEVDVVGIPHLLEDVLHVIEHALEAGQHEGRHLLLVVVLQVSPCLHQNTQIFGVHRERSVVDGLAAETILDIDDVRKYLKELTEKLGAAGYGSSVDRRAEVGAVVVLDQLALLQVIQQGKVPHQQVVVLLAEVQRIAAG